MQREKKGLKDEEEGGGGGKVFRMRREGEDLQNERVSEPSPNLTNRCGREKGRLLSLPRSELVLSALSPSRGEGDGRVGGREGGSKGSEGRGGRQVGVRLALRK